VSEPSGIPGYWMNETSGVLAPVVEKYLRGEQLAPLEVGAMRAYLRQWIAGGFQGPEIVQLRREVERIASTDDVRRWLSDAMNAGIDPL